ncbi:MAG: YceK/YidQ family lipoprotein [Verrucomicrobia bacterium]|nr:YceK/YidQ family lipoprotein [Verrucomicrobiota bacterium]
MKRIMRILLVAVSASLLSGCATVVMRTDISGSEPKGLYPATRADVSGSIRYCRNKLDPFGGWRGAGTPRHPNIVEKCLWVVFSIIDFPISIVTDTVCFPWDLSDKIKNKETPTTDRTVPPEAVASGVQ